MYSSMAAISCFCSSGVRMSANAKEIIVGREMAGLDTLHAEEGVAPDLRQHRLMFGWRPDLQTEMTVMAAPFGDLQRLARDRDRRNRAPHCAARRCWPGVAAAASRRQNGVPRMVSGVVIRRRYVATSTSSQQ